MPSRSRAKEVLPPSRLRATRRKRRLAILLAWVVFLFVCVGGLVALLHLQALRIRDITVKGAQTISTSTLQDTVAGKITGTTWGVIPRNSVLFYSGRDLERGILNDFPKIKTAKVALDTFHGISISVVERTPAALWCGSQNDAATTTESVCGFLDEEGYAYEVAPSYSGSAYVRWYGALQAPAIPALYLSSGTFHSVYLLIESLRTPTQTPVRVVIDSNNDVFADFAEGFQIRFSLTEKSEDILSYLKTALASVVLKNKKLSDLEYLDLRFGTRVYYKFK